MEALFVRDGLTLPSDALSVSFTRDLGGEIGPEAARRTPTTVELRLDVGACAGLDAEARRRILALPALVGDRRGTVRVVYGELPTRRRNLFEARRRLAQLVIEALARDPDAPVEAPVMRRRGRGGLIKGSGGSRPDADQ